MYLYYTPFGDFLETFEDGLKQCLMVIYFAWARHTNLSPQMQRAVAHLYGKTLIATKYNCIALSASA